MSEPRTDRALVLHVRPFRESSQLVELLLRHAGRTPGIVRGARRRDRRGGGRSLDAFGLYEIELRGRGEVPAVSRAELCRRHELARDHLFAGLYVNELLMASLHRHVDVPAVFDAVLATYEALAQGLDLEPVLRTFELGLLRELGVGLDLDHDAQGRPLDPQTTYVLQTEAGWVPRSDPEAAIATAAGSPAIPGHCVLAIGRRDFADPETRRCARRLLRGEIDRLIGGRPLRSREYFRAQRRPRTATRPRAGAAGPGAADPGTADPGAADPGAAQGADEA